MKKILLIFLSFDIVLLTPISVIACGDKDDGGDDSKEPNDKETPTDPDKPKEPDKVLPPYQYNVVLNDIELFKKNKTIYRKKVDGEFEDPIDTLKRLINQWQEENYYEIKMVDSVDFQVFMDLWRINIQAKSDQSQYVGSFEFKFR